MKNVTLLALGVALLAPMTSALAADDEMRVVKPIRLLAGIFSATNGTNKQRLSVGVGYDILKTKATNPTIYGIFLDYNTKESSGLTTMMTGVGVSARFYQKSANAAARTYAIAGIGSYSLKTESEDTETEGGDTNSSSRAFGVATGNAVTSTTTSKIGGKLGIGYERNDGWLAELDYTTLQKIGGKDPGGINFRLGYRF